MMLTKSISVVLSVMFILSAPVQAEEFLPVDRKKILDFFSSDKFEQIQVPDQQGTADMKRLRAGGDTVWLFYSKASQTRIAMAGRGDLIHSVRIVVAVVNNSEEKNEKVLASLSALFSAIYPNWPQARDWPSKSLDSSWSATAQMMENSAKHQESSQKTLDESIAKQQFDGITASTYGVPPDLIVYAVTVREECVPKRTSPYLPQNDPIQRAIC